MVIIVEQVEIFTSNARLPFMHSILTEDTTCVLISFSLSQKACSIQNSVAKSSLENINSLIMLMALTSYLTVLRRDDVVNGNE